MGGHALDREIELTRAAVRARHLAALARRLEHEREHRLARLVFDPRARAERAELLVGVEQHREVAARELPALGQRAQRGHQHHQPALHVGDAGAQRARRVVRVDAHALERRVTLEDGVEVTDQEHVPRVLRLERRRALGHDQGPGARVLAIGIVERGARLDPDLEAERREFGADERREGLEARGVPAAGVAPDPVGELRLELGLALFDRDPELDVVGVELAGRGAQRQQQPGQRPETQNHFRPRPHAGASYTRGREPVHSPGACAPHVSRFRSR
ncbi:MAG TPA: hypothetical protein VMR50_18585 [Myxococcota bacterium]|nr:hypothetical protein [Myxococcota bacterium]